MSEEAPAIVGNAALAIDCTDPLGLARWWSRVLGGSIDIDPQGYATLRTPEGLAVAAQKHHHACARTSPLLSAH